MHHISCELNIEFISLECLMSTTVNVIEITIITLGRNIIWTGTKMFQIICTSSINQLPCNVYFNFFSKITCVFANIYAVVWRFMSGMKLLKRKTRWIIFWLRVKFFFLYITVQRTAQKADYWFRMKNIKYECAAACCGRVFWIVINSYLVTLQY